MGYFQEGLSDVASGLPLTFMLLVVSLFFSLLISIVVTFFRYNNQNFHRVVVQVVSIIRGTPLLLQISFVYFVFPRLFSFFPVSIFLSGVVTFSLHSFAYVSEVIRAGVDSIPTGQFEAARTLNIPSFYMWRDIIFPQVLKNIFPALINEVIDLLKSTSMIATIGGLDVTRAAQLFAAEKYTYFFPFVLAGLYYYLMVLFIEYMGRKVESVMNWGG